ncbi:protogenin A-like [Brienomyrus brachyistius]|uniref:protogenin A-like n=1 Tax=Brienomyrus brachyistius TaxID=42636 RepID=UPI0020B3933F|nr:protogenin A-like [Brienomyrus brachyistius]
MKMGILAFSELFFVREPHDLTVLPGESVLLDCHARGEVPIAVRWLRNGANVQDDERVQLLPNGSLRISQVESGTAGTADAGFYQCLAQNQYGAILSQKSRLTVAGISTFVRQPSPAVLMEGSVARFSCKVTAHPPAAITWELNEALMPLLTDRITVLPSGVLQIHGVEAGDSGKYRCMATNIASRHWSTEAMLTVKPALPSRLVVGPHIIAGPQNLTLSLHATAVLECLATGQPRPIVSWSRADHKPMDVFSTRVLGAGNLIITDVRPQHAGVYVCRATTPGTRNYTVAMANLTVLAPPSLVEWPESLTRPRAGTARFSCQAEGMPQPNITWLKNGAEIHSNGRIKMYSSKLVINQITPEDDAIYQCLAENEQGSVLATARLIVVMSEDRPSAPRNVRADTVSSSAILLAWDQPLYNADRVIAYSVHYMNSEGINNEEYQVVIGNDTTRYIIDDLEAAYNYTFYIVAYMPNGASRMSDHVVQCTLEDVPLHAPELNLLSRSPTDIQVSWQPLTAKFSRGRVSAYRLSLRTAADGTITQLDLPGDCTQHLLEGLRPDTLYLLRVAAATSVGWGEPSAWTSHRTPPASSTNVPLAPLLQLEPLNCTTMLLRWRPHAGDAARVLGYWLSYRQEGQTAGPPIQLPAQDSQFTIQGLDPRRKYHIKLLAYSIAGAGYQADQTASTPGCVSVRDRMVPPPPPPHRLHATANSSTAVYLRWDPPAFTVGQAVSYTVRCHPVGLQNASLVLYLQTKEQALLIRGLEPNTKYEFAVRLHVDQLASPWSAVAFQTTLPEAPTLPPSSVKVTLIESDTALVSWKQPEEPNLAVTRYTILYASRQAWVAGEWQVLQREGTNTMALLENLLPGNVYLVRISASNQVGDGPFSREVELAVLPMGSQAKQNSGRYDATALAKAFSDGFFYMDQKSMMGIVVGVSIALGCILLCALILLYKSKSRKFFAPKTARQGSSLQNAPPPRAEEQTDSAEALVLATAHHFIDAKGGTDMMVNGSGPVKPSRLRRNMWWFVSNEGKQKSTKEPTQKRSYSRCSYQLATTVLRYEQGSPSYLGRNTPTGPGFGRPGETEGSQGSEGTGDSGHYSHDEADLGNMADTPPLSLGVKEAGACSEGEQPHLVVEMENLTKMASQPSQQSLHATDQVHPL